MKYEQKQKKLNILAWILLFGFIFFLSLKNCLSILDVDLGWHLRVGKDLITKFIWPKFDLYSFSHMGYPWVDHEWLSDAISYLIYAKTNFIVLSLIFALILVLIFYFEAKIIQKINKNNTFLISGLCFILASLSFLGFIAVRMQVISWLGLVIMLYLLLLHYYENYKKILFYLPILMLLWVNLHGGFVLGLALLFLYTIFSPKDRKILTLILCLSILMTFVNPYFFGIWKEVWQVATDSFGKSHIVEWAPLLAYPLNIFELIYLAIFIVFIILKKNYQKIPLPILIFLGLTLVSAIMHKRNMPVFIVASLPFLATSIERTIDHLNHHTYIGVVVNYKKYLEVDLINIFSLLFINLIILLSIISNFNQILADPYKNPQIYFYQTKEYLIKNNLTGRTFANFALGGYLLWTMPKGYQVFYDGRMVHWRIGEERFLKEYLIIYNGEENWPAVVEKYQIKNIIIPKNTFLKRFLADDWLNRLIYKDKILSIKNYESNLHKVLKENIEWELIYENDESYIYAKTN